MATAFHTRTIIANHVRRHEEFRKGNISAERYEAGNLPRTGQLPSFIADQLKAVIRENNTYVVFSYNTPIGWVILDGNDNWFIPNVKYSTTTTHHQHLLKVFTSPNNPY